MFTSAGQTSSFTTVSATNLETATGAANAIEAIDGALDMINLSRAELGAYNSRFESIISSVAVALTQRRLLRRGFRTQTLLRKLQP